MLGETGSAKTADANTDVPFSAITDAEELEVKRSW
jgi:hypothetical protein